jgi:hypothetical protein
VRLVAQVAGVLRSHGTAYAVIGAAALSVHGVARATADLDLLAVDAACLNETWWTPLGTAGVTVDLRRGDPTDPLAGVARFTAPGEAPVDVIVGRDAWQRDLVARALPTRVAGETLPVVRAADLVLLKLYAGGPQDAWDVDQLLDAEPGIEAEVEAIVARLPPDGVSLWQRICDQRRRP